MSFVGHLEEFRWHLLRSVIALLVGFVLVSSNLSWVVNNVILGPLKPDFVTNKWLCSLNPESCSKLSAQTVLLQALSPTEQFTRAIVIAAVGGLIMAFPYLVWELWRFVKPGLQHTEVKGLKGVVVWVSLLFLGGVLFSYFLIAPLTLNFFASFQLAENIQNQWRIGEVVGLIVQISLGGGLLFQLPVVVWVLSKLGFLTPALMRRYRRHAFVVVLIVAGILTPDPSMISQLVLGIPMFALYEASIWISARESKRRLTV